MPSATWTASAAPALVAVPPPPLVVAAVWGCPAGVFITATRLSVQDAMPSRIVAGQPHVFGATAVRYVRGTYGLMPDDWGVVEDAQLSDAGGDIEKADGHGTIYAAGVATTVYRLQLAIRMPADRAMPAKGDQFYFFVRGEALLFTVWSGVSERWNKLGLRMVDVPARHYADMPDAVPEETDLEVPQDLGGSDF